MKLLDMQVFCLDLWCWPDEVLHKLSGTLMGTILGSSVSFHTDTPNEHHYFRPKVLIWDPIKLFTLSCMQHNDTLKPSFWFGKQTRWRQPRLLYDIGGNVLLVGRYCHVENISVYMYSDKINFIFKVKMHMLLPLKLRKIWVTIRIAECHLLLQKYFKMRYCFVFADFTHVVT